MEKIYQPSSYEFQEEYGSFVVFLSKESLLKFCKDVNFEINENNNDDIFEMTYNDVEEATFIATNEEIAQWIYQNLNDNDSKIFYNEYNMIKAYKNEDDSIVLYLYDYSYGYQLDDKIASDVIEFEKNNELFKNLQTLNEKLELEINNSNSNLDNYLDNYELNIGDR